MLMSMFVAGDLTYLGARSVLVGMLATVSDRFL